MLNLLVIDDELNISNLLKIRLEKEGYNVFTAIDGLDGLDQFYENHIDLVIVDIMMPKMNGYEFLKEIRKDGNMIPAIMISAKGSIEDKDKGFELGIDDYLVKPFDFKELIMRIKALFRRAKIHDENKIVVKDVILDANDLSITNKKKGISITLTKKEFQILFKLLSYPEKAFTKWQIYDEFWGLSSDTDDNVVKVFISKIRKQIEVFPEINIETIVGIGYRGVKKDDKK